MKRYPLNSWVFNKKLKVIYSYFVNLEKSIFDFLKIIIKKTARAKEVDMTNISSTSSVNSSSYTEKYKAQLSSSTKRQLEALGIDPSSVTSESQALALIKTKQSDKKFEDAMVSKTETSQTSEAQESSETQMIAEAKTLAEQLGVSLNSDATFDEITAAINDAIQKLIDKSGNDPQALQRAQSYMTQLSELNNRYSSTMSSTNNMYAAMNNQAANTKYMLGL